MSSINARVAAEIGEEMAKDLFEDSKKMAEIKSISIAEAIDLKVKVHQKYAKNGTEIEAWEIRGNKAKAMIEHENSKE